MLATKLLVSAVMVLSGASSFAAADDASRVPAATSRSHNGSALDADRVMAPFREWWYRGGTKPAGDSDAVFALVRHLRDHATDPETLFWAAMMQDGRELKTDRPTAELLAKSADGGFAPAKAELGRRLLAIPGDPVSNALGNRYLDEAYAARDPDGAIQLGIAALTGAGGRARDDVAAERWFREGLAWGSIQAHWGLAEAIARRGDFAAALNELRAGAAANDVRCMIKLAGTAREGKMGQGVDPAEAIRWMKKAADAGSAMAQREVAKAILSGYGGLRRDETEARRLIELAAKGDDPESMLIVALGKRDGSNSFEKDAPAAARMLDSLVERNYPPALFTLAKEQFDSARPADLGARERAVSMMRRAADAGYAPAVAYLRGGGAKT